MLQGYNGKSIDASTSGSLPEKKSTYKLLKWIITVKIAESLRINLLFFLSLTNKFATIRSTAITAKEIVVNKM
jgi:hypothetical protein